MTAINQNNYLSYERRGYAPALLAEAAHCENLGYDVDFIKAFLDRGVSLWRLPELDLKNRIAHYIDFLKPQDLTSPMMRFTDGQQRPGLALRISLPSDPSNKTQDFILALFKEGNLWKVGTPAGAFTPLEELYDNAHAPYHKETSKFTLCEICPPFLKNDYTEWAISLIKQQDGVLECPDIEQTAPLVLLAPSPKNTEDQNKALTPPSESQINNNSQSWLLTLLQSLWAPISWFLRKCSRLIHFQRQIDKQLKRPHETGQKSTVYAL